MALANRLIQRQKLRKLQNDLGYVACHNYVVYDRSSGERDRFYLDKPVNVHRIYLPTVVSPEGHTEFPSDVYQQFKKSTLAKGPYPDNIQTIERRDPFSTHMTTTVQGRKDYNNDSVT